MWDLDLAFADVVATSSDPNLGAIRLAWWRERLEELDQGQGPPAEPRLQAVARDLLPFGVTGGELSELEDAWLPVLHNDSLAEGLKLRGRILFRVGARLLGADAAQGDAPGEFWSLIDGARFCGNDDTAKDLAAEARSIVRPRAASRLRPLTVVAALAGTDGSGLRRGLAALAHRYRGTYPRG